MKVLRIAVGPVVGLVVGVVVGVLGSVAHWGHRPWGLVASLVLVLASATMMRAWAGRAALAAQVVGLGAALEVLSWPGRGSDALVQLTRSAQQLPGVDPAVYGRIWVIGSVVAALLVAVAPGVLFSDRPLARQAPDEEPVGGHRGVLAEGPAGRPGAGPVGERAGEPGGRPGEEPVGGLLGEPGDESLADRADRLTDEADR